MTTAAIMADTISAGTATTEAVSRSTHCEPVYGCSTSDSATEVSSTTVAACTSTATGATSDNGNAANAYVYPQNCDDVGSIPELLADYAHVYKSVQATSTGYTVYYWVPKLDRDTMEKLQESPDVAWAYYYEQYYIDDSFPARGMDDDFEVHGPYHAMFKPPYSFLVFAIAKLSGQYRQLAVAQYEASSNCFPSQRMTIVRSCRRVITTLSDPANRTAIQGELALADAAYANRSLAPPPSKLRSIDRSRIMPEWERERVTRWWNRDVAEFPFIATCLVVSVGQECNARDSQVTAGPLGLMYTGDTLQYGMAVVDISDLDRVKYGIVAFGTTHLLTPWGLIADEAVLEPMRPRRPLSAKAYLSKFTPINERDRNWSPTATAMRMDTLQMEKYQLVGLDALEGRN